MLSVAMHHREMRLTTSIRLVDGELTEGASPLLTRRRCIDFVRISSSSCRRG
jgi:hypothetical protein